MYSVVRDKCSTPQIPKNENIFSSDDDARIFRCSDARDNFSLMLLERLDALNDELNSVRGELKSLRQGNVSKLRIEGVFDINSKHINIDIMLPEPKQIPQLHDETTHNPHTPVTDLTETITSVVASFSNNVYGTVFLTQYCYTDNPRLLSFHMFCSFSQCVNLLSFYKYLEENIPYLANFGSTIAKSHKQKQRVSSVRMNFANGIPETLSMVAWAHESLLQFILVDLEDDNGFGL